SAFRRVTRGSTLTVRAAPLTLRLRGTASGPSTAAATGAEPTPTRPVAAAPTPAVFRKGRRENPGAPWRLSEGGCLDIAHLGGSGLKGRAPARAGSNSWSAAGGRQGSGGEEMSKRRGKRAHPTVVNSEIALA